MDRRKRQSAPDANGWMIYGATGSLGELIIQQALAQGLTPVMGGRSIARLRSMADKYQLPWRLLDLDQPEQAVKALSGIDFVYNAATENTVAGLVEVCQAVNVHLMMPHQLSAAQTQTVSDSVALSGEGAAVMTGAGFHTAAIESLLAVAQSQPNSAEFTAFHVALLGLPFLHPGYTREFLNYLREPTQAKPAARLTKRQTPWYDVMLKQMAQHTDQAWRGLGGKSLTGMRWWSIRAPEHDVAPRRFAHTPLSVYLPIAPWLLPVLKHFSGVAVGLLEPALGRAAQMPSLRTWPETAGPMGQQKDRPAHQSLFSGLASIFAQLVTRQGQGPSRSAVWLVAEHGDGRYSPFGLEFPAVYETVAALAVIMARDLLGKPVAERQGIAVTPQPGVQTAVECFGANVVLAVPDSVRFGSLKKAGVKASSQVTAPVETTESTLS